MRDKIQSKVAVAFDGALADAVKSFVLTRTVVGEYDPVTGEQTSTTETFSGRGVFGRFKAEQVDNQHILATDEKLTVLQSELSTAPADGDDIDGKRVMTVGQDPAATSWTIQLRDA